MSLRTLWYYLTSYSSALTALASLVGVVLTFLALVAAGVYAFLTWRLAQAAKAQAEAARLQAEASRQQAEASVQQARAAAEQARTTRQIFEASHRPIVGLLIHQYDFFEAPDFYRLNFEAKNHGQVPAILTESRLVVRRDAEVLVDRPVPGRGRCIFPDGDTNLVFEGDRHGTIEKAGGIVDVELTVSYHGFDEVTRTSRIGVVGN